MKQLCLLFLIAITCMANQCGGDFCDEAPACDSTVLGTLALDSASRKAIPFQGGETVTFVNPQGFQAHFKAQPPATDTDERYVNRPLDNCGRCTENYLKQRTTLAFTGTNLNFSFTYQLLKNISDTRTGTPIADTKAIGDVLAITLGQVTFAVPLTAAPIEINAATQFRLYDSLVLGPKTFFQVYEVTVPNSGNNIIMPKGIYYTRQQGLVGYLFNNNERWYKQ